MNKKSIIKEIKNEVSQIEKYMKLRDSIGKKCLTCELKNFKCECEISQEVDKLDNLLNNYFQIYYDLTVDFFTGEKHTKTYE